MVFPGRGGFGLVCFSLMGTNGFPLFDVSSAGSRFHGRVCTPGRLRRRGAMLRETPPPPPAGDLLSCCTTRKKAKKRTPLPRPLRGFPPSGGSLPPAMPGGVFANSPFGLRHAKPFFRPSSPPVGTSEGTGNAGDQRSVALSASGEARCSSESPSEPLIRAPAGGAFRRGCLSPKGEFRAGRLLGAAQGRRPKADR